MNCNIAGLTPWRIGMGQYKAFDFGSLVVILITLVLFALALFTKGFAHDLLLESGVFLVSVKLIMMAYRSNLMKESIENKLDTIHAEILRLEKERRLREPQV